MRLFVARYDMGFGKRRSIRLVAENWDDALSAAKDISYQNGILSGLYIVGSVKVVPPKEGGCRPKAENPPDSYSRRLSEWEGSSKNGRVTAFAFTQPVSVWLFLPLE